MYIIYKMPRLLVEKFGLQQYANKVPFHNQLLIAAELTMSVYVFRQFVRVKLPFLSQENSQVMEGALLWTMFDSAVKPMLDKSASNPEN